MTPAPNGSARESKLTTFASAAWSILWMPGVWLVFTGFGPIVPLFFLAAHQPGMQVFDSKLLASGDLLLISIVLVVASLGALLYALCAGRLTKWRGLVGLVFAGQFFIVGMGIYEYMRATTPQAGQTWGALNSSIVAHGS